MTSFSTSFKPISLRRRLLWLVGLPMVVAWLAAGGWQVAGVVRSPITGPEGNVEFLVAARAGKAGALASGG